MSSTANGHNFAALAFTNRSVLAIVLHQYAPSGTPNMTELSVVVPIFNESESIEPLLTALLAALEALDKEFEVIVVDDGSTDGTAELVKRKAVTDDRVKLIVFRRNFGQTAALMAGFDHSGGEIVVAIDGDGQNDPTDIARLLDKLDDGFDVVSGWRKERKDNRLTRRLPSRAANLLISSMSGISLHDYGCTLKAYRKDVLRGVRIYGEMHRFIPIYASWEGARVTEIPVRHFPRTHGRSKYGVGRTVKVFLDLITITFLSRFSSRPIYLFGSFGLLSIFASFLAGVYSVWLKFAAGKSFIETPVPLLVVMLFIIGIMAILMGLLSEIVMRTYYESQGRPAYTIKESLNLRD